METDGAVPKTTGFENHVGADGVELPYFYGYNMFSFNEYGSVIAPGLGMELRWRLQLSDIRASSES